MRSHKEYLGDGAYVEFDGFGVILTTSDGVRTTNEIFLEPEVLGNFEEWMQRLRKFLEQVIRETP